MYPDDKELIKKYLDGDTESLRTLISRYLEPVYNFVYYLSGNPHEAHDITQETFIKVWKNLKKYDPEKKFSTWVFSIARNTTIDWIRKKHPEVFSSFETDEDDRNFENTLVDEEPLPDELFEKEEERKKNEDLVEKSLATIPLSYKTIILLHDQHELTFQEIAEIVKKPMNTVKSQYRRGIALLRDYMHQNRKDLRI